MSSAEIREVARQLQERDRTAGKPLLSWAEYLRLAYWGASGEAP